MAKKTNVPLKRRRRSELNVKLIAIIAAVLFVGSAVVSLFWLSATEGLFSFL